jgi:hypothetical protein
MPLEQALRRESVAISNARSATGARYPSSTALAAIRARSSAEKVEGCSLEDR